MLRSMLGKVARKTPGLRRFLGEPEAPPQKAPAPSSSSFGSPAPKTSPPVAKAAPAPAAVKPTEAKPAPVAEAAPTAAPTAAPPVGPTAAPAAEAAKPAGKKASPKKASGKKAAAAKAAPVEVEKKTEGGRDTDEVEALRAEAEQKKAEIRARKEAEKAAAAAPQQVSGIAALIAQGGGTSLTAGAAPAVKATSGVDWVRDATLRTNDEGIAFWGPVDNESSRAKARGDTLIIDQWECINCGTCVENTDLVFALPDDAKAVAISQEGPMDLIQDAIDACPVTCIHWTAEPAKFEQLNDAEGNPLH